MMSELKPMPAFEKQAVLTQSMLQLAIEAVNPTFVPDFLRVIESTVLGYKICSDGNHFLWNHAKALKVHRIPESEAGTLRSAADFIFHNYTPPTTEALASVGASSDKVVLNINHAVADGNYLVRLIRKIIKRDFSEIAMEMPITPFDNAKHMIDKAAPRIPTDTNPLLSRVFPQTYVEYTGGPALAGVQVSIPTEKLMCFNPETKRVHNISEALWAAVLMSLNAYHQQIGPMAMAMCVNLRRYLRPADINWNICNYFTHVIAKSDFLPNMTLGEVMAQMRSDFNKKLVEGAAFDALKAKNAGTSRRDLPGIPIDISSIGAVRIMPPIKNLSIFENAKESTSDMFFTTYSVVGKDVKEFRGCLNYSPKFIDPKEAEKIAKTIEYSLMNSKFTNKFIDEQAAVSAYYRTL